MGTQNTDTNTEWRKRLLNSYLVVAIIIAVVEFLIFFLDEWAGLLFLPKPIYFLRFFVFPSAVNFSFVIMGRISMKSTKIAEERKNRIVAEVLAGICIITQITHYVFGPILCVCGLPIFMSCIFGDKKLSFKITIAAYFALVISALEGAFELRKGDNQLLLDVMVAATFYLCCYFTARVLIGKYESDKALLQESLEEQIMLLEKTKRDPLTGLYNRKVMFDDMTAAAVDKKSPMWLAVFDMDDFKNVNDSYGHSQGDEVLMFLATLLKKSCNSAENAYRFGGEEFAILFIEEELPRVMECLETIRATLEKEKFDAEGETFYVTVSIGAKQFEPDHMTINDFFMSADVCIYDSKQAGKNRITIGKDHIPQVCNEEMK